MEISLDSNTFPKALPKEPLFPRPAIRCSLLRKFTKMECPASHHPEPRKPILECETFLHFTISRCPCNPVRRQQIMLESYSPVSNRTDPQNPPVRLVNINYLIFQE